MFTQQLEFIQFLHQLRSPLLDRLVQFCDYFDRQEFLFILMPIIWFGLSWQWGMRVFYLLSLSQVINYGLKGLFALPRPFHLDPTVAVIQVKGHGFPSGAAQTAVLLAGLLLMYWKSKWKWIVAILYIFIISFSRLYLGVHFPMDILGGWVVGFLLLGIYQLLFHKVENFLTHRSPLQVALIHYFFLLALMVCLPSKTMMSICACAIGLGSGVFINRWRGFQGALPKTKWETWIRISIGIAGVFALYNFFERTMDSQSFIKEFCLFAVIGFWISFGNIYFYNKLKVLGEKEN